MDRDERFGKRLDKVVTAKSDKKFLRDLAKWLVDLSGNVNAAQRLNVLSDSIK